MSVATSRQYAAAVAAIVYLGAGPQEPAAVQEIAVPSVPELEDATKILELLNEARDAADLVTLIENRQLDVLAYQHSREMARRGRVAHHSYEFGLSTKTRVGLAFPRLLRFAENVARNRNPERVHAALMASRGHRLNRMDPDLTHVGIGVARAGAYQIYVTELFARPADSRVLDHIQVLYTQADAVALPHEEARHGEIVDETVRIPTPTEADPEYWTQRGIDAFNGGDYAGAVELFRRALRLAPDYEYARFDLGRALLALGDGEGAMKALQEHLRGSPGDLDASSSLGSAALLASHFDVAEAAFRKVLAARPRNAITWYNLGLALEYQDRPSEAENAYAQALHLDSTLAAAAAGLARVRH